MDHKKLSMEQALAELKRLAAEMNCSVCGAAKEALLQYYEAAGFTEHPLAEDLDGMEEAQLLELYFNTCR